MSKKAEMFRRLTLGLTPDRAAELSGIRSRKVKNKYTADWHRSQALPDHPEPPAPPAIDILDRDISTLTPAEKVEFDKAAKAAGWKVPPQVIRAAWERGRWFEAECAAGRREMPADLADPQGWWLRPGGLRDSPEPPIFKWSVSEQDYVEVA
jgi:hypothetical protein